ncbi:hypothetical protein RWE15_04505 [Virgibacillus halophilus]|uniref:Uncharacterized protein n=1 Tax=Tigheibacillus halophilus TaxID=361280 RepID=A0ABU5C3G0_9BACI|nr:hypothetical protein [Virgibacillus halophilus]
MNKEEELLINFRDLFNKLAWLNKPKMEEHLKDYKPSEVHCIESIEKKQRCQCKKTCGDPLYDERRHQ